MERSVDGRTIYFRREPNGKWDGVMDWTHGAAWMFQDLQPGKGVYYKLSPA